MEIFLSNTITQICIHIWPQHSYDMNSMKPKQNVHNELCMGAAHTNEFQHMAAAQTVIAKTWHVGNTKQWLHWKIPKIWTLP